MTTGLDPDLSAPDAVYVRQRWIPQHSVEWAENANRILMAHGAVWGRTSYPNRHQARYRARKLLTLLVDLRLRDRWEVKERVQERAGEWAWAVEYIGRSNRHARTN